MKIFDTLKDAQLRSLMSNMGLRDTQYTQSRSGLVDISVNMLKIPSHYTKVLVPLGKLDGCLEIQDSDLVTLKNCPRSVTGWWRLANVRTKSLCYSPTEVGLTAAIASTTITSLLGAPEKIGLHLAIDQSGITSLHDVHKTNPKMSIGGTLVVPKHCTHLLGLAYIPGVTSLRFGMGGVDIAVEHDPFLWQEKLLDLGLTEQAQL